MSTTDDEVLDDIRRLADELGLERRPYVHDDAAAEVLLAEVLAVRARPPRRRRVAFSLAVAASVVALVSLIGLPDTGGESAGGDSAGTSRVDAGPTRAPTPSAGKAIERLAELSRLDCSTCAMGVVPRRAADLRTAPGSIVLVDDVSIGRRTSATVVESLKGDLAAGDRIVVDAPSFTLVPALGSTRRFLFLLAGSTAYATFVEASPGRFVTTRVVNDGSIRELTLGEVRAALE